MTTSIGNTITTNAMYGLSKHGKADGQIALHMPTFSMHSAKRPKSLSDMSSDGQTTAQPLRGTHGTGCELRSGGIGLIAHGITG